MPGDPDTGQIWASNDSQKSPNMSQQRVHKHQSWKFPTKGEKDVLLKR
jgi:hypothetical protein